MRLSIFGLGYVGVVSAACLAREGHTIIGVDPNELKVEAINRGRSPIIEAEVDALIADAVKSDRLSARLTAESAVAETDMSIICVGTPSQPNGSLELKFVRSACTEIGHALKRKAGKHVIVVRSTMLPGSVSTVVIPAIAEASGMKPHEDFGVAINPEFLREGTAVQDYLNPPKTIIGCDDPKVGASVAGLYNHLPGQLVVTNLATAEMVKYVDNVWHALKVGFANEVGNVAKALGIDGHSVMELFCLDTKLNLSPYYLKPGFAFGGSCLPKDLRAFTYKARSLDVSTPILEAILPSNDLQVRRAIDMIMKHDKRRVGILGFSFKAGTDDLRESPMVELIERLLGKGHDLKIYDRNVNMSRLVGANREFILRRIPHIAALMVDSVDEAVVGSDIVVIGNGDAEFRDVMNRTASNQVVVDLVRVDRSLATTGAYEGICW